MLPLSTMDEVPAYPGKSSTKDSSSTRFQNTQFFTSEKLVDLIVIFSFHTKISIHGCVLNSLIAFHCKVYFQNNF